MAAGFKKCPWTPEEDMQLVSYIRRYGIWNWSQMPKHAGLSRSGKSYRLRWMNYLNPEVRRGNYTLEEEDEIIISMRHMGVGWSAIAARLSGRTDNEIKNRWHSHLKKRIANNVVEIIEPKMEQIESTIDTLMTTYDHPNDFVATEAPKSEVEVFEDYPMISSYMLNNIGASSSSSNNIAPPAFGTSADPHISFWREPYSLEDVYGIDQYATCVDPEFGMPRAQDWFGEPFYPYYDIIY